MSRKFIENDIMVESRNRNLTLYPDPWSYNLQLGIVARGVVSFALSNAIIKKQYTTVTRFNQWIDFQELNGTVKSVQIPVGDYNEDSLCMEIQDLLNDVSEMGWAYSVYRDPLTDLVTFRVVGGKTNFLFNSGANSSASIHVNLGFPFEDSDFVSVYVGAFHIHLEPTYVDVVVDEVPQFTTKKSLRYTRNLSQTSRPETLESYVVARIPLDNGNGTNKYFCMKESNGMENYFKPRNFPSLTIHFYDNFGHYYNPYEHTLVFKMIMLKDYNTIHQVTTPPPPPKKEYIVVQQPLKEILELKDQMSDDNARLIKNIKMLIAVFIMCVVIIIALLFLKSPSHQ